MSTKASEPPARTDCPECGGALLPGSVTLPLLGPPRFAYRLGAQEISTEVEASMCHDCGLVRFEAKDVGSIRRAFAAASGAQSPRTGRSPGSTR